MELISSKDVITRKVHKCWGCAREFPKGTEMNTITSSECGEIMTNYWCKTCEDYWDKHLRHYVDGIAMGELQGEPHYEKFREEKEDKAREWLNKQEDVK